MPVEANSWPSRDEEPRLFRWRQWTDWSLTGLAAAFLCCYALQFLYQRRPVLTVVLDVLIWVTWSSFALDWIRSRDAAAADVAAVATATRSRVRRLVAATLMVGGIALLGVVTGLVASWLVRTLSGAEEAAEARTAAAVSELHAELAELRRELSERHEAPPPVRHWVT